MVWELCITAMVINMMENGIIISDKDMANNAIQMVIFILDNGN